MDQRADGHLRLELGQRAAEAEVRAVAEAEVPVARAGQVEPVGVLEALGVPVGRGEEQVGQLALAQRPPADRDVLGGDPDDRLGRRVVAGEFLDGRADQHRVLAQPGQLVGVAQQGEHAVADQVGGGLVAAW